MRRFPGFCVVVIAGFLSQPLPVQAQPTEVERAAAAALATFVGAWNRAAAGDSAGVRQYGELYWAEADLVDPMGSVWEGQPAVVQMHVDLWQGPFKGSTVRGVVRKTRALSPVLMIADLDLALSAPAAAPPGSAAPDTIRAHLKFVMEKRGSAWKVISSQNTFYGAPPPGPPPVGQAPGDTRNAGTVALTRSLLGEASINQEGVRSAWKTVFPPPDDPPRGDSMRSRFAFASSSPPNSRDSQVVPLVAQLLWARA
ncbi:MAG: SgcJ/EcaC family oxidoreductase [Gemmatimonadaceae bacterium]